MIFKNEITLIAQALYPEIFTDTSHLHIIDKDKITIGDSCAEQLCKRWQEKALLLDPEGYIAEANVAGSSPIDLLDVKNGIAYELKYSQKNVKHEFYKDLFKILIHNEESPSRKITKFVFLCHYKGIASLLRSSLSMASIKYLTSRGIEVHLVELFPKEENFQQTA